MPNVAGKFSRALHTERLGLVAGDIDDFEFTRLNDKELRVAITRALTCHPGTQTFLSVRQTGIPACFFPQIRQRAKSPLGAQAYQPVFRPFPTRATKKLLKK